MVTPVAARIATQTGSRPARISGTTILMITTSVSASAISDRTPRQPPTTVTATAKIPSRIARTGMRYRSPTVMTSPSGSMRGVDDDLVADVVARQVFGPGRPLEEPVDRLALPGDRP